MTVDPALVDRFRADLGAADRLGVAVSGGPDSLALLLLAHEALPGRVAAATVDHGLRPEGADEAAFVGRVCAERGVPHTILTGRTPASGGGGAQARARATRYPLLIGWAETIGLERVATAHHLDDQAETVLMRLARGSGTAGLAGIRPVMTPHCHAVRLVRPLLGWRRAELAAIIADAGLTPVDDPSNRSEAHDRTHIRALLAREPLLAPERLAAAAAHLADDADALAWAVARAWDERVTADGDALLLDPAGLPRSILFHLARRAIDAIDGQPWRDDSLARLLDTLASGRAATIARVKVEPGPRWRFALAPPRRL